MIFSRFSFRIGTAAQGLSVAFLAAGVTWLSLAQWNSDDPSIRSRDLRGFIKNGPQCGHWAIFNASQLLGVQVSMQSVGDALPQRADGHSLADLRDGFRKLGITAIGIRESFDSFTTGMFPAVVHLNKPDHFIVAVRSESPSLLYFDASGERVRAPTDEIRQRWSGNVLRLSRRDGGDSAELSKFRMPAPRIRFDSLYVDRGNILGHEKSVEYVFRFRNSGSEPLEIGKVKVNCSCLSAVVPTEPIPPGESDSIRLVYRVDPDQPQFLRTAAVTTNDPELPVVILRAAGNRDQTLRISPDRAGFGDVVAASKQQKLLLIRYFGDGGLGPVEILSSDKRITATVTNPAPHDVVEQMWPGVSMGTIERSVNMLLIVEFEASSGEVPTAVEGSITLRWNHSSPRVATIPVNARTVPKVRSAPGVVRLPDHVGAEATFYLVHGSREPIELVGSNAAAIGFNLTEDSSGLERRGFMKLVLKAAHNEPIAKTREARLQVDLREKRFGSLVSAAVPIRTAETDSDSSDH